MPSCSASTSTAAIFWWPAPKWLCGSGNAACVHAGKLVIFVVNQTTAADQRPQHAAEHALVLAVFGARSLGEISPHQIDDIDAAVGASGPQAADHQFVMHDVVAHHMKGITAVDPLPDQIGFRRRQPGIAIAHQKTPDRRVVHDQKTLKQADAGIFVLDIADVGAIVAQKSNAGPRRVRGNVIPTGPPRIDRAAEHEIDHGAVSVKSAVPHSENEMTFCPDGVSLGSVTAIGGGFCACLGIAQLDRTLSIVDRRVDLPGVESPTLSASRIVTSSPWRTMY